MVDVLPDQQAIIDVGGVRKQISTALIDSVAVGDYVILHVGYAIGKLDEEEARRTLAMFGEAALTTTGPVAIDATTAAQPEPVLP